MKMSTPHHRTASWLLVTAAAAAASCVGTLDETYPASTRSSGPDAGAPACDEPVAATDDGHHEAGEPCRTCHGGSGPGPTFAIGGTLYDDTEGSTPVAGATVRVVDAAGTEIVMTTSMNGNFWSTAQLAPPLRTRASACPTTLPMATPFDASGGDCNKSGCHAAGFRAHVP